MSTEKFHTLRHQHPMFSFVGMEVRWPSSPDRDHRTLLAVQFDYEIEALDSFSSTFSFPLPREPLSLEERQHTEELLFRLGMIEALSYWKLTCSPYFVVPAGALTTAEVPFWEALFYEGLSEFRYRNEISARPSQEEDDPFISFIGETTPGERTPTPRFGASGAIIPIGGGKDSIVTLEVLQQQRAENTLFFLNPRPACLRTAAVAGYTEEECLLVRRDLDEKIKHYNAKGFLNGHTPFSALLGFTTVVSAFIHQKQEIVLSNEGSASEGNVLGADVNHQYSKSFHFEEIFSDYVRQFLAPDITYFSLLRPLNEVQIGAAFAKCDQYFTIFRSCNVGCYTDSWCCTCPKCLFTALLLAPFLEEKSLAQIFPKIPLNDTALSEHLLDLCLSTRTKPFECVGTHEESLALAAALLEREESYPLLSAQSGELQEELSRATSLRTLLEAWNDENQLPSHYEETLREQTHRWHPPTPSNSREVRAR